MTIYADSSFFVSLHVIDRYSHEAWKRVSTGPSIGVTPLNRAEFAHAVFAHVFWKKATLLQARNALADFDRDIAAGTFIAMDLPAAAFDRSVALAQHYGPPTGVRALDSLHVACALELGARKFWTFDERQTRLAEAVGLDTTG